MSWQWGESDDPRAMPVLAQTIYRALRAQGFQEQEVVTLASELLGLIVHESRAHGDDD